MKRKGTHDWWQPSKAQYLNNEEREIPTDCAPATLRLVDLIPGTTCLLSFESDFEIGSSGQVNAYMTATADKLGEAWFEFDARALPVDALIRARKVEFLPMQARIRLTSSEEIIVLRQKIDPFLP